MREAMIVTVLLSGACVVPDEPLEDKGQGVWQMMAAPELAYRALWGANERDVIAVGDDGVARLDGEVWELVDVPVAVYRAVWGRSATEAWIGGDGVLLASSYDGGWQPQSLWHDGVELTDYSVVALSGSATSELALVHTGGVMLLFRNEGAFWSTVYWQTGLEPRLPPQDPALLHRGSSVLVGGDDDLLDLTVDALGLWSSAPWIDAGEVPRLAALSGGWDHWAGAGGATVVLHRVDSAETLVFHDELARRDAHGVAAIGPHQAYVVGQPIALPAPDPVSGAVTSPIEACDLDGCALEEVVAPHQAVTLEDVWLSDTGAAFAVGPKVILRRGAP